MQCIVGRPGYLWGCIVWCFSHWKLLGCCLLGHAHFGCIRKCFCGGIEGEKYISEGEKLQKFTNEKGCNVFVLIGGAEPPTGGGAPMPPSPATSACTSNGIVCATDHIFVLYHGGIHGVTLSPGFALENKKKVVAKVVDYPYFDV